MAKPTLLLQTALPLPLDPTPSSITKDEKLPFKVEHHHLRDNTIIGSSELAVYPVPLHEIVGSVLDAHFHQTVSTKTKISPSSVSGDKHENEGCETHLTSSLKTIKRQKASKRSSRGVRVEKKTELVKKYDERELDSVLKSVSDEFETLEFNKKSSAMLSVKRSKAKSFDENENSILESEKLRNRSPKQHPSPPKMIRLEFCPDFLNDSETENDNEVTRNSPEVFPGNSLRCRGKGIDSSDDSGGCSKVKQESRIKSPSFSTASDSSNFNFCLQPNNIAAQLKSQPAMEAADKSIRSVDQDTTKSRKVIVVKRGIMNGGFKHAAAESQTTTTLTINQHEKKSDTKGITMLSTSSSSPPKQVWSQTQFFYLPSVKENFYLRGEHITDPERFYCFDGLFLANHYSHQSMA